MLKGFYLQGVHLPNTGYCVKNTTKVLYTYNDVIDFILSNDDDKIISTQKDEVIVITHGKHIFFTGDKEYTDALQEFLTPLQPRNACDKCLKREDCQSNPKICKLDEYGILINKVKLTSRSIFSNEEIRKIAESLEKEIERDAQLVQDFYCCPKCTEIYERPVNYCPNCGTKINRKSIILNKK